MNSKYILLFAAIMSMNASHAMEQIDNDLQKAAIEELVYGCEWKPSSRQIALKPCRVNYHFFARKVKKLLAKGVDINGSTPEGYTPLIRAAQQQDIQRCEILLAHGADINVSTEQFTPLSAAAEYKHFDGIPGCDMLEFLVARGAEVDKFVGGKTPLMMAASINFGGLCKVLLNLGANPLVCDARGRNALFYAADCTRDWTWDSPSSVILEFIVTKKHLKISSFITFLCCLKALKRSDCQHDRFIADAMYQNRRIIWGAFIQNTPSLVEILQSPNNDGQTAYDYALGMPVDCAAKSYPGSLFIKEMLNPIPFRLAETENAIIKHMKLKERRYQIKRQAAEAQRAEQPNCAIV